MLKTKGKPDNRHSRRRAKSLERRQRQSQQVVEETARGVGDNSFPKAIAAAGARERSSWDLAFALLDECGPPSRPGERTGSDEKVREAQAVLDAAGFPFSFDY